MFGNSLTILPHVKSNDSVLIINMSIEVSDTFNYSTTNQKIIDHLELADGNLLLLKSSKKCSKFFKNQQETSTNENNLYYS